MTNYRVGSDISTLCGKCKQRTYHAIFAMEGPIVKRVQCKICMSYHNFHADEDQLREMGKRSAGRVSIRKSGPVSEVVGELVSTAEQEAIRSVERAPGVKASKSGTKSPGKKASSRTPEPDYADLWGQALDGKDMENMHDYQMTQQFKDGDVLNHNSFGVGIVMKVKPEGKIEVLFNSGPRTLIHGRS